MRAVQISAFGDPLEVAKFVEIPEPAAPGPGQVLLGIEFAPVNPNDLMVMGGQFPFKPSLPSALGNEGVGRVLAIGPGVTSVKVGDRATPPLYSGTWRERMLVPAEGLFALPEDADVHQLAMMRINPPTAALLLTEYVDLQPGDWVIQNAGNSGVGRAVIAIAKAHGNKTISFVRRKELIPELEAAGGDLVLLDDGDAAGRIANAVGNGSVRLALDGVSGAATARLVDFLSPGGSLVGYAMMSGEISAPADLRQLMNRGISVQFFYQGRPQYDSKIPVLLHHSANMIADGTINVPVAAIYPLSAIREAIAHVQSGGKVLLEVGRPQ